MSTLKTGSSWTILIYANGNNELEPELFEQFNQLSKAAIPGNVSVAIQFSRASESLLKLAGRHVDAERWSGVRRYVSQEGRLLRMGALPGIIMADPHMLFEFITWGMATCPADNTMLILSGHSGGYIGALAEYNLTANNFSVMSIPGMCRAVSAGFGNKKIDALVLDTCLMNMIEVWFELAFSPLWPISYLVVPSTEAPREGLPWNHIVKIIGNTMAHEMSLDEALKSVGESLVQKAIPVTVVDIHYGKNSLVSVRNEIDRFASFLLERHFRLREKLLEWRVSATTWTVNLIELEQRINEYFFGVSPPTPIKDALAKAISWPSPQANGTYLGPYIYLPATLSHYSLEWYKQLMFTTNNAWLKCLTSYIPWE